MPPSRAEIEDAICEMTQERGFIINSFSQFECRLADLIDQCQKFGEYADICSKQLPFGVANRVARVRELIKTGPLAAHAAQMEKWLSKFMEFEEIRHLFVHGYATFIYTPQGDMGMQFFRYVQPEKGQKFSIERKFYRLSTIKEQRKSSTEFAEGALKALREIYVDIGLDPDALSHLQQELSGQV